MIKIAIIDDEKKERDVLNQYFDHFFSEKESDYSVYQFVSGKQFLFGKDELYDLICLDIDMPEMDGIELARAIREYDSKVLIIFITNMAQMAIKGYEVRAFDFILKPLNYYSFKLKLENALSVLKHKMDSYLVLNTLNGMVKIVTSDITYVEVSGHYLYYHTLDTTYKKKAPLREVESKLQGQPFKRCNNCYLINLKYVDSVNKYDVCVNGEWLKISRPRKSDFMEALANYMGGVKI